MATSGSVKLLTKTQLGFDIYYIFDWQRVSYSAPDNTSTISWSLSFEAETSYAVFTNQTVTCYVGSTFPHAGILKAGSYKAKTVVMSGESVIAHNPNGEKTVDVRVIEEGTALEREDSTTFELDRIALQATFISAPNFNDEESPTITYSNPAGNKVTSLQACVSFDGTADNISYRDIPKDGSSYTFNFTNAERAILRKRMTKSTSTTLYFYIRTIINGFTYHERVQKTLTLVNYLPKLAPTVVDTYTPTIELTGNKNILVKYFSNAYFNTGAAAQKEATIDYQTISNGAQWLEDYPSNTGTINNIESNTFYFTLKDSRGFITRDAVVFSEDNGRFIPYVKLTADLSTAPMSPNGRLEFTVKGKYFNGSFGAQRNSMQMQYALQDENGDFVLNTESGWQELGEITPEIDGSNYSYSHTITGLDYQKQYKLTVNVNDALMPIQDLTTVISAIPVFDWGKDNFHHHTDVSIDTHKTIKGIRSNGEEWVAFEPCDLNDNIIIGAGSYLESAGATWLYGNAIHLTTKANYLTINGRQYGANKVLWSGEWHMNANQIANLSESVSAQPNGIVLVFSHFEPSTGYSRDVGWTTHFVPKQLVNVSQANIANQTGGQSFLMGLNAGFGTIGAKYLFIENSRIGGHSGNTSTGTNSGITFKNNQFVLRYVIGV